jgi:hypothetical protein
MNNGEISNNTADGGGGVYVGTNNVFTMADGKISSNTAAYAGGVSMGGRTFTMNGGEISNNITNASYFGGGGVHLSRGTFTMNRGKISGNTATASGGGVYVDYYDSPVFRIVNGIIYGFGEAEGVRNTATLGAALYKAGTNGIAEYGTFSGEEWDGTDLPLTPRDSAGYTNNTIKVEDGVLIQ